MKSSVLHEVWGSPDNTRLTPKQYSFRLPLHVAAQLTALGDMYPQRSRTQIVADLLTAALDELERNLPDVPAERVDGAHENEIAKQLGAPGERVHYVGGLRGEFRRLSNEHYRELEIEAGGPPTDKLFGDLVVTESELNQSKP